MIFFEGRQVSFHQLVNEPIPHCQAGHLDALQFCRLWLGGQQQFLVNTSGSTGPPATVCLSRSHMQASARSTARFFTYQTHQHMMLCLPANRIGGIMQLVRAMETGMNIYLGNPWWKMDEWPELPAYSHSSLTPHLAWLILQKPGGEQFIASFHSLLIGGAAVHPALASRLAMLPNRIYETYGMTETCSHIALKRLSNPPEDWFTPLPGVQLSAGKDGCLHIRVEAAEHGSWQTTDRVELLPSGQFRFLGRADFAINSGGIKLHPEQLEQKVSHLFSPGFVYVFSSMPHQALGEALVLVYQAGTQLPPRLQVRLSEVLLPTQMPHQVLPLAALPTTAGGKPDRIALKKMLAG